MNFISSLFVAALYIGAIAVLLEMSAAPVLSLA